MSKPSIKEYFEFTISRLIKKRLSETWAEYLQSGNYNDFLNEVTEFLSFVVGYNTVVDDEENIRVFENTLKEFIVCL